MSKLYPSAQDRLSELADATLKVALLDGATFDEADETLADVAGDEITGTAGYSRKTINNVVVDSDGNGRLTVRGDTPQWVGIGTGSEQTTALVTYVETGSTDADRWLVSYHEGTQTLTGGTLVANWPGGYIVKDTEHTGGATADTEVTSAGSGATHTTGSTVAARFTSTEATLASVAGVLAGPVTDTATSLTALKTFLRIMAETATGGAVTLPTDRSLIGYDLDPGDNPWVITIPDLTAETESIVYHVALLAQTGGNVAVSFVSEGSAQDVVHSGPAPSEIPEEGLMLLTITAQAGALGKVYIDWASNIDGWGLTGHSATVASGTHLFSHAFEHVTLTGTDPTLARDLTDAGGGSGMFWLKITNSSGSTRTITWGPTITWVAGSAVSTIANGATVLVMLQTLDSGATATGVNVTGISGGTGDLLSTNNLSDLASASTARTNLGLGTVATLASDTDGTLAANSDSNVATQKAVKTYADTKAKPARWHSIDVAIPPLVTGTYTFGGTISGVNGAYMVTDYTNDQALEWDLDFDGGTWRIDFVYRATNSNGIATFSIDGSSVGTIDTYAASSTNNNYGSITGITVAAGRHTLKLSNPTKNGSSGTYYLTPQSLGLRRTGA